MLLSYGDVISLCRTFQSFLSQLLTFKPVYIAFTTGVLVVLTTLLLSWQTQKKNKARLKAKKKKECALNKHNYWKEKFINNTKQDVGKNWVKTITEMPTSELLEKLSSGGLKSTEVLKAFVSKAMEITEDFNCITEFIIEAESWAKELDKLAAKGMIRGPLHGLPFSVKDNVSIKGYDSTVGLTKFIDDPSAEDAALVAALKSLGAIPFCKTNVPQTLLSFGCSNPIFGTTSNPWCKDRTPGGSTGGEACLIAAGGSPFGIGSDIGGSARIPPAFCGIPSIKFTSFRLSYHGFRKSAVGCVGIHAVPGILARDSETISLISKLLLEKNYMSKFDSDTLPIPWNELVFTEPRKLKIGYYDQADYFPTTPGIRRAIENARRHLISLGHELVPFTPPKLDYVINSVLGMFYADQGRYVLQALEHDDLDPIIKLQIKFGIGVPHFVKRMIVPVLSVFAPRMIPCILAVDGHQIRHSYQLWEAIAKQGEYRSEFLSKWRSMGLDLCIGPCFACPAPLSKDVSRLSPAFSYACLYNFLDLPAGIAPITRETEEDQHCLQNMKENDLVVKLMKKNTEGAQGLPLSVQIIGLPYQEELVLRGIKILGKAFRKEFEHKF